MENNAIFGRLLPKESNDIRKFSAWSQLTFSWVNPLMFIGVQRQLDHCDLLPVPDKMTPAISSHKFWHLWIDEQAASRDKCEPPSLTRVLMKAYGWQYAAIGALKLVNDALAFVGPLLLHELLTFLALPDSSPKNFQKGYCCAAGLGLTAALRALLGTQYTYAVNKLALEARASITTAVFRKSLSVRLTASLSGGEIQTLMAVDSDRIVNLCGSIHELWSLPLQIVVALILLFLQVRYAFLAGLLVVLLLIPFNRWLAIRISKASQAMMRAKDIRVRRTEEMLSAIRIIKMMSWEVVFKQRIDESRQVELRNLAICKYLDALCVYCWACTPVIFSVCTFSLYSITGHDLTAATVFTCLALFNVLLSPLNSFPWVINGIVEAGVSLGRLRTFLTSPDVHQEGYVPVEAPGQLEEVDPPEEGVSMEDASFSWTATDASCHQTPLLHHISFRIPQGSFVAVIGPVGSGKSSLLAAILGEMNFLEGRLTVSGDISLAPQEPWIQSGTLQDNILFGSPLEDDRYHQVLTNCALIEDIATMPNGDLSEIGERGVNLSGGQKARLSLARAIYKHSSIMLLDDPLSAVDAAVSDHLLQHAICGSLVKGRTRFVVTHSRQAIKASDMAIVLDRCELVYAGPTAGLPKHFLSVHDMSADSQAGKGHISAALDSDTPRKNDAMIAGGMDKETKSRLVVEEVRQVGKVRGQVYLYYLQAIGWSVVTAVLASTSLMQASRNGSDLWLSHWVDSLHAQVEVNFYISVLAAFGVANSFMTLARAFWFAFGGLKAARLMHDRLVNSVMMAPTLFFDCTPSGRILNRLSSDQDTVDSSLPFISNILLAHSFSMAGFLTVLTFAQWTVFAILLPLTLILHQIQRFYREASRELRRLDSASKSPIYALFSEALQGGPTIRAFLSQDRFQQMNQGQVAVNQRAAFSELAASLWLSVRLQTMAAAVVAFVSLAAVISCQVSARETGAGTVGLSLSYALPIVSLLNDLLTCFTETEKEMVSVERMQEYSSLQPEAEAIAATCLLGEPSTWPSSGGIEFRQVSLRYRPQLPLILNCVSFVIPAGSQVAIAGRTGAGKSTIFGALLRTHKICHGSIMMGGRDTSTLSLRELRSRVGVIPQTPFLFEGSVRDNLDPTREVPDPRLWTAIRQCNLLNVVSKLGGLDAMVPLEGLSLGEKQLFCLVRALVMDRRVLCLDECTANVDNETSGVVEDVVREMCAGDVVVIAIAHRRETLFRYERVLVMENGYLVDDGHPLNVIR